MGGPAGPAPRNWRTRARILARPGHVGPDKHPRTRLMTIACRRRMAASSARASGSCGRRRQGDRPVRDLGRSGDPRRAARPLAAVEPVGVIIGRRSPVPLRDGARRCGWWTRRSLTRTGRLRRSARRTSIGTVIRLVVVYGNDALPL